MAEGHAEFAPYEPDSPGLPRLPIELREARPEDAAAVARLDAERNQLDPATIEPHVRREFESIAAGDHNCSCFVAEANREIIAYARVSWKDYAALLNARNIPSAWYLSGLVVTPKHRRRGVGAALTRRRLDHLLNQGVQEVWFFSNVSNQASIALHEDLGFEEVTRDFSVPDVIFRGGIGVLFRARITP